MAGGQDFFEVTKAFHNALHGGAYRTRPQDFEIFLAYNERNRGVCALDAEFVVIHDPQPAALIDAPGRVAADHWIWRCHIDLSQPESGGVEISEAFVSRYDGVDFLVARVFAAAADPAISVLIPRSIRCRTRTAISSRTSCASWSVSDRSRSGRILTQISRFDRLKDPVGVLRAYRIVKRYFDCQLVLAGGGASDDPEGAGCWPKCERRRPAIRTSTFSNCRRGSRWKSTRCSAPPPS